MDTIDWGWVPHKEIYNFPLAKQSHGITEEDTLTVQQLGAFKCRCKVHLIAVNSFF